MFDIICATDKNGGIGKHNTIPWSLPNEFKYFKNTTLHSYIIMGHNTWKSLPNKPLSQRINIIISSTNTLEIDQTHYIIKYSSEKIFCCQQNIIYVFKSFDEALSCIKISECDNMKNTFVIGGSQLYNEAITHSDCDKIYLTKIYNNFDCDTFFPDIPINFKLYTLSNFNCEHNTYYRYHVYHKLNPLRINYTFYKNEEEFNYIYLLRRIINYGEKKSNRTGVSTLSLFSEKLTYDLSDTFPILTTRKQFLRGIFEELQFYIRGQTNNNILVSKGVNVWTGNTTRSFLDSRNLDYDEGDMGPTYGFNFRYFGGEYKDCNTNYEGCGFDQLSELVHTLKTNKDSRRMIITLWDPENNVKSSLPSCMCFYQFYVSENTKLNLQVYIRSSDYFLANNWNTCTAALFVHLLCNTEGINLTPGTLSVVMGDAHIYTNQLEAIQKCLHRIPKPFPKLVIKSKKDCITEFTFDDISLIGYEADKRVKVDMVV
jgi:dihydrofolate reductase / thymidylate synthase